MLTFACTQDFVTYAQTTDECWKALQIVHVENARFVRNDAVAFRALTKAEASQCQLNDTSAIIKHGNAGENLAQWCSIAS